MSKGITSKSLISFCSAILPSELGGPDPNDLAVKVLLYLNRLPKDFARGYLAAVNIFDLISYTKYKKRLSDLDAKDRDELIQKLYKNKLIFNLIEALKAVILLVNGAYSNSLEINLAANKNPVARKTPKLNIISSHIWPSVANCDVVIVGSGAGGSIVAKELSAKGADVVIVEEGQYHDAEEFRTNLPLDRFASMYRDGGSTALLGLPPVIMPIGRGVGGTTLINSGTCYRTPDSVLDQWYKNFGLDFAEKSIFKHHLDSIEKIFEVGPVPLDIMGKNGLTAMEGAKKLNWKTGPLTRNAPGCDGCCQCAIGCPHNAKLGVHLSVLPQACKTGTKIVTDLKVHHVITEDNKAIGLFATRSDKSQVIIYANTVVISAGATETPGIIRRSDITVHPQLGRNLAVHPAVAVAGRFDEEIYPWRGVLQSASVEEFHDSDGILIEATATPPGMGSMVLPGIGSKLLKQIDEAKHLVTLGAMISDGPNGKVSGKNRTLMTYKMSHRDGNRLIKAIEICSELLFAAGAREVLTGVSRLPVLKSKEDIKEIKQQANFKELHVAAFHPTGSLRAGTSAVDCPTDIDGQLRGCKNLYVIDGSVIPSSPTVNPQVSIMAVAEALSAKLIQSRFN